MKAAERRKAARAMARALGVRDVDGLQALVEQKWHEALDNHQRVRRQAAAESREGPPPAGGGTPPPGAGVPADRLPADGRAADPLTTDEQTGKDGPPADGRPTITISTREHEVNAQAAAALGSDPCLYQRGGLLVRVVRDNSVTGRGIRRPVAPRIDPLPPPLLREKLAECARWVTVRETEDGSEERPAHPPGWCVTAVHARADYPAVRHLEAIVDHPVLRPDGTVLCRPGYDPDTGLILEAADALPGVAEVADRGRALEARDELLEVVTDFPFERPEHRAAWLAALLTPLARFAFAGPAPLFLADANVPGAGKGLMLHAIARILRGDEFTVCTYTQDEDELRKRIFALALAGERLVLFDNLEGRFGCATLDAVLTASAMTDRVLGASRTASAPLLMTWYATGNNVIVSGDTVRRVCHIRLESPEERPEEKRDFAHPDLLGWVGENRRRLLGAALTILRGYCLANRPDMKLQAWGSFGGWSALVRSAVAWVGLPDPGLTRTVLRERSDTVAEGMTTILNCWERMDPDRAGLTAAEVVRRLYPRQSRGEPAQQSPAWHDEFRAALESLLGRPDARSLGNKLRCYRRRLFSGRYIDRAGTDHQAARWGVYHRQDFKKDSKPASPTPGESGESGESSPPAGINGAKNPAVSGAWTGPDSEEISAARGWGGGDSPDSPDSPVAGDHDWAREEDDGDIVTPWD
jgi:hypothetical protein